MGVALQARTDRLRDVCRRRFLRPIQKAARQSAFLPMALPSWSRISWRRSFALETILLFSLELQAADSSTEIYIRSANPDAKRRDLFQTRIGYASQPRKDKRNNLFIPAEALNPRLGISAIYLPNETLRDYFYVGNRHRAWDRQTSCTNSCGSTATHPWRNSVSASNSALLNSAQPKHPTATSQHWSAPSISLRAQNCELVMTLS